jgi:hypothetical protein
VDVPRMEPPPASLEAMVRSRPGSPPIVDRGASWVWIAALLLAIGAIAYYVGFSR